VKIDRLSVWAGNNVAGAETGSLRGYTLLTAATGAKDLEPVALDFEIGLKGEILNEFVNVAALELNNVTTAGADDVVAVAGASEHITVGAIRLVDALQHADLDEHIDGAEHGGSSDTGASCAKLLVESLAAKHAFLSVNLLHHLFTWFGDPETSIAQ
jgi:hypothetical protein